MKQKSSFDRREFLTAAGASLAGGGAHWIGDAAGADERAKANAKSFQVIDTHFHLFNSALQGSDGIPRVLNLDATVEAGVSALKRGGVDKAFLITYNAQDIAEQFRTRKQDPAMLRRVFNTRYQIAAWKAYPDVFYWFPDHIDPLRETYLEDLERDFEAGAAGIKLLPIFHGLLPDHPGFQPVYQLCQQRQKPIILDISWWYMKTMPPRYETPQRRESMKQFSDYAKLLSSIFRQYPKVAFSLAHTGAARDVADYDQIFRLIADHPNVSCDIAASTGYNATFIQRLVKAVGARKVMYGTDWPYWSSGPFSYTMGRRRWTMITEECPDLSEDDKRLILGENALRFLKNELIGLGPRSDAAVAERAKQVHRHSIVIVMHDHNPIADDVDRMLAGGVTAKVYQLLVDIEVGRDFLANLDKLDGWTDKALAEINRVRKMIQSDKRLMLALSAKDFGEAKREGKIAIMIGVEGAKLLEGKLEVLKQFYDLGLRELQLRWAVPNQIVEQKSLTAFGTQVVRECQRLGIIVDLTHIPTRAFYEVIDSIERPPIVSHGATAGDLEDRKLKAIASRGGVVGIHFYSTYLGRKPTVDRVVDQIDYIKRLVGVETAGLGVDFFPTQGKWREFQLAQGTKDISWAIEDIGQLDRVTHALAARNYSDEEIRSILGGNFLRVCRDVIGK